MKKYNVKNYVRYKEDVKASQPDLKDLAGYERNELITKFLPWAENIGRKFSTTQQASGVLSINDIIQIGSEALTRAVDKLDWSMLNESDDIEKTLKSFLSKRIKGAMRRRIDMARGNMRIPEHKLNEIRKNPKDKKMVEIFFNSMFLSIDAQVTNDDEENMMYQIADKSEPYNIQILNIYLKGLMEKYLDKNGIACRYIHSDVDTMERVEILRQLRLGDFDTLIGVNLLREGLDLPEVSLVAILDADKEGFLRSHRSLTQTIGRAARNVNGLAILYADKMTNSMQKTIDQTNRRRQKQIEYNTENNITPTQITKAIDNSLTKSAVSSFHYDNAINKAAEADLEYLPKPEIEKRIRETRKNMELAAKALDFLTAAQFRDEIEVLKKHL